MDEKNEKIEIEKNKFLKGALCGALVMLVLIGAVLGGMYVVKNGNALSASKNGSDKVVNENTETKLELLQAYVKVKYLHQKDVDSDKLEEGLYKGYVEGLSDPYSEYYTAKETKEMSLSNEGKFGGIGVTMSQDNETQIITLLNIQKDSPAEKAGIEERDVLYKVNGENITSQPSSEVVEKVRGDIGSEVKITVVKAKTGEQKEYTVIRDKIDSNTVFHEMVEGNVGHIYVKEFDTVTYEQFQSAMEDLEKQGMEGLIVDLRNNGGGSLDTVCQMLDLILPKGTIVYTEDKNGKKETFTSDEERKFTKPIAVLVNEYTASASEIFAGAIQDYGLGNVVGTTTYGKGVVQNIYNMQDGSSVKLTTAQYFTPKGRCIQGTGIKPDLEVEWKPDNADETLDNQFQAALEDIQKKLN
ncbi:MAG: S41 family peptidase [Lachnospiraceae bacterium]